MARRINNDDPATWGINGLALLPVSPQHGHSLGDIEWDSPQNTPSFLLSPPTFWSLHLSWAHHYWALNWGFLETSSRYLAPHPVEPGKLAVPLHICFRWLKTLWRDPGKQYTWEPGNTAVTEVTHTDRVYVKVITRQFPCQRGSCYRSVQKPHLLAQYLPKQNGVFGFCFGVAMLTYIK